MTALWVGLAVGGASFLGSLGWVTAFALAEAAYVKTVGQVELLFALVATRRVFGERIAPWEGAGMLLVAASILMLIWRG